MSLFGIVDYEFHQAEVAAVLNGESPNVYVNLSKIFSNGLEAAGTVFNKYVKLFCHFRTPLQFRTIVNDTDGLAFEDRQHTRLVKLDYRRYCYGSTQLVGYLCL
jgi:hypothetical protein